MKRTIIFVFMFATMFNCVAREKSMEEIEQMELHVASVFEQVKKTDKNAEKTKLADSIQNLMIDLVYEVDSFDYDYPNIPQIGKTQSSDKEYFLYSWNILLTDGSSQYFSIIQNQEGYTYVLAQGLSYKPIQTGYVMETKWYGALYYDLIATKYKDKKVYLALGWARNGDTQYKIIDVLSFTRRNVKFGAPLFTGFGVKRQARVVFEYGGDVEMSMTYDKKKKRVVFDHLTPIRELEDGKQVMGPDMSVDALVFKKKMWTLVEDIKIKNKK